MWAAHQVHHSSEYYNLTTALRQSVLQIYTSWVTPPLTLQDTVMYQTCTVKPKTNHLNWYKDNSVYMHQMRYDDHRNSPSLYYLDLYISFY